MATTRDSLVTLIVFVCLVGPCFGQVLFSSLKEFKTLAVSASPMKGQVLKAGEDSITVSWSLNETFPVNIDALYKTVSVKLCYAPISQKDRGWRKTVDNLKKDKTCQFKIVVKPYAKSNNTATWLIEKRIPQATYFIRAYALNAEGHQVGFGQTTNVNKTENLFDVQAITGRHISLDIASVCFSAFSVLSLAGFFIVEKRKAKAAQNK